jgi:hypothetical protein
MFDTLQFVVKMRDAQRLSAIGSGGYRKKLTVAHLDDKLKCIDFGAASLKRRARLLITNSSIPRQTRSLIRYALEIKDPHLAQVVRRVEGGEMVIERLYVE